MKTPIQGLAPLLGIALGLLGAGFAAPAAAADHPQLEQFRETGRGIQTSAFGTWNE